VEPDVVAGQGVAAGTFARDQDAVAVVAGDDVAGGDTADRVESRVVDVDALAVGRRDASGRQADVAVRDQVVVAGELEGVRRPAGQ